MRLCFIGCEVLTREVAALAAQAEPAVDLHFLPHGLHNVPDELRRRVQAEIDRVESGADRANLGGPFGGSREYACDAILLGYGLCSNGTAGLGSKRFPLVIPRAHDCITFFLGSKEAYRAYFDAHPGTYWYTAGWIERSLMPGPDRLQEVRERYVREYGEENADFLLETESAWYREYSRATYIHWNLPGAEGYRQYTRDCARCLGWQFDEYPGDQGLLEAFVTGDWDGERFLVVPPGEKIEPSYDEGIVKAAGTVGK